MSSDLTKMIITDFICGCRHVNPVCFNFSRKSTESKIIQIKLFLRPVEQFKVNMYCSVKT